MDDAAMDELATARDPHHKAAVHCPRRPKHISCRLFAPTTTAASLTVSRAVPSRPVPRRPDAWGVGRTVFEPARERDNAQTIVESRPHPGVSERPSANHASSL
jgi:hypothetical protein